MFAKLEWKCKFEWFWNFYAKDRLEEIIIFIITNESKSKQTFSVEKWDLRKRKRRRNAWFVAKSETFFESLMHIAKSILPTFCQQLFHMKLLCTAFLLWKFVLVFFFVEIKLLKLTIDINFTNLHNNNMFRNCMVVKLNGIFFPQVSNARAFEHNAIWLVKCCQIVLKLLPCANSKK